MLGWIRNKLSAASGTSHPFPKEEIALLRQDLAKLDELRAGVVDRIIQFLVDGDDKELLLTLAQLPDDPAKFCLRCNRGYYGVRGGQSREKFFEATAITDPAFHLRLALCYEALASQTKRGNPLPGLPASVRWLETYLFEATRIQPNSWPARPQPPRVDAQTLEQMLALDGLSPALLVRALLWTNPANNQWGGASTEMLVVIGGMADSCLRHSSMVEECLRIEDHRAKVHALDTLRKLSVPMQPFVATVATLACSSAKTVRESAQSWLMTDIAGADESLKKIATEGDAEDRLHSVKFLAKHRREEARAFLEERAPNEKAKKVREAIITALDPHAAREMASNGAEGQSLRPAALPELPPLPEVDLDEKLDAKILEALKAAIIKANAALKANWEENKGSRWSPKEPVQIQPLADRWFKQLMSLRHDDDFFRVLPQNGYHQPSVQPIFEFAAHPGLKLVHVFRWVCLVSGRQGMGQQLNQWGHVSCFNAFIRRNGPIEYRVLANICRKLGFDDQWLAEGFLNCSSQGISLLSNCDPKHVWTYFADHRLNLLKQALGWDPGFVSGEQFRYVEAQRRQNAWLALSAFPVPPPTFVPDMWEVALGSSKTERPLAQAALQGAADRDQRVVAALGASTQEQRAVAAEWIGRLKLTSAIPDLRKAATKEKYDVPKAAMLAALELLGVPPDEFLDRAGLAKAAEKVVSKEPPAALTWFPFDLLPAVHWIDTGKRVDPVILKAWLIQACRLKAAEASPLIRRYAESFVPAEREALGEYILHAWMTQDLSPQPRAAAEAAAMQTAQSFFQGAAQHPQFYGAYVGKTLEQLYAQFLPSQLEQPIGSAGDSKGILAVAGACIGAGAARPVAQYLKKWYGIRLQQSKALLQMLAWVEHPSATQTLLAIGTRFRTKTLQEEATRLASNIAARKGWSLAELADRTVSSAGMDEDGVLRLDFGPRQFTARLDAQMNFTVFDPEGKTIKALPDPRKDDDETLAAASKKQLSSAKKELKQIIEQQRANLYEAMCVERHWSYEDWEPYLNKHPVLRHFCQRLVWRASLGDQTQLFRPLADGTLTDVEDNAVTLTPEHQITLEHISKVSSDEAKTWLQHLQDYEVEPVFDQFSRAQPKLTEEQKSGTELKDFEGWLVETFKLRTRATKLGYTRGSTGDGGWFHEYMKRFTTSGLTAVIEFTGNCLPEENRTAAMVKLTFQRHDGGLGEMTLSDVPAVLLAECWNDFRQMAAEGPGFDPDWRKKSEY